MDHFFDIAFTPAVTEHQRRRGASLGEGRPGRRCAPVGLDADVQQFLTERDSVYLASVGEDGWPYVQHRGGPPGFITVLGPTRIAWVERPGNRQYITAGHLDTDDRVALIAVDYPTRRRLKLYGHARYLTEPTAEELAAITHRDGRIDGLVVIDVVASAWNCPKHITPRYTADQIRVITDPLVQRIGELEAEIVTLRGS